MSLLLFWLRTCIIHFIQKIVNSTLLAKQVIVGQSRAFLNHLFHPNQHIYFPSTLNSKLQGFWIFWAIQKYEELVNGFLKRKFDNFLCLLSRGLVLFTVLLRIL